jgi:hypothetical protein
VYFKETCPGWRGEEGGVVGCLPQLACATEASGAGVSGNNYSPGQGALRRDWLGRKRKLEISTLSEKEKEPRDAQLDLNSLKPNA